jgi:hypothetical protein
MDTTSKDNEGVPPKGSGSQQWLRDLWGQKNFQTPLGRTGARGTLPVFFDRDGRVGPSALWWKVAHSFASSAEDGGQQEAEEAELARAAQAALEIAQVSSKAEGMDWEGINQLGNSRCIFSLCWLTSVLVCLSVQRRRR